jgi:hypothetical protein
MTSSLNELLQMKPGAFLLQAIAAAPWFDAIDELPGGPASAAFPSNVAQAVLPMNWSRLSIESEPPPIPHSLAARTSRSQHGRAAEHDCRWFRDGRRRPRVATGSLDEMADVELAEDSPPSVRLAIQIRVTEQAASWS